MLILLEVGAKNNSIDCFLSTVLWLNYTCNYFDNETMSEKGGYIMKLKKKEMYKFCIVRIKTIEICVLFPGKTEGEVHRDGRSSTRGSEFIQELNSVNRLYIYKGHIYVRKG